MSACPAWTALVAHRFERDRREPEVWRRSLEHARQCPDCRRAALAADPTLVFATLDEPSAATPASAADLAAVAAMRRAVETLRRAQSLTPRRSRRPTRWRLAAAAILPLVGLLLPAPPPAAGPPARVAPGPALPAIVPSFAELAALPLVEDLGRPQARVYELGGPDLAVVMIVDETLDV